MAARMSRIEGVPLVKECEAFSLLKALLWASNLSFQNVVFESDSKIVVDVVLFPSDDHTEFEDVNNRCRTIIN